MTDRSTTPDVASAIRSTLELCSRVEADLGLPAGFVSGLPQESDWTFIVKSGAIAEAAINQLLIVAISDARIHGTISRLRLRGPDGKLALAIDLGLVSLSERRFLERIATLRNAAVHDVHSFSLTFASVLLGKSPQDQKQFWQDLLGAAMKAPPDLTERATRSSDAAKFIVWFALVTFIGRLHWSTSLLVRERELEARLREGDSEQASRFRELLKLFYADEREQERNNEAPL